MHFATFRTEARLGSLQRALDELARAGFDLLDIRLTTRLDQADVRIDYAPTGSVPPQTYLARLSRIPGIEGVYGDVDLAPAMTT